MLSVLLEQVAQVIGKQNNSIGLTYFPLLSLSYRDVLKPLGGEQNRF